MAVDNFVHGTNTFSVRAHLNGTNLQNHMTEIIKEQIQYLQDEKVKVAMSGQYVVYQDQHLEYWEKAFQKIRVSETRPVRETLDMVLSNGVSGSGSGSLLPGLDLLGGGLNMLVDGLVDRILDEVKGLEEDEVDNFSERLGLVSQLFLELLQTLGVI